MLGGTGIFTIFLLGQRSDQIAIFWLFRDWLNPISDLLRNHYHIQYLSSSLSTSYILIMKSSWSITWVQLYLPLLLESIPFSWLS